MQKGGWDKQLDTLVSLLLTLLTWRPEQISNALNFVTTALTNLGKSLLPPCHCIKGVSLNWPMNLHFINILPCGRFEWVSSTLSHAWWWMSVMAVLLVMILMWASIMSSVRMKAVLFHDCSLPLDTDLRCTRKMAHINHVQWWQPQLPSVWPYLLTPAYSHQKVHCEDMGCHEPTQQWGGFDRECGLHPNFPTCCAFLTSYLICWVIVMSL